MTSRTCIARIPLDDGSDLAASLDADGAADARLWTRHRLRLDADRQGAGDPALRGPRGDRRAQGSKAEGGGMMPQKQAAPRKGQGTARFPKHGLTARRHGWGYHKVALVTNIPGLGAIAQRMPRGVVKSDNKGGHYVECVGPEAATKKGWKRRRRTLHIWRNTESNGTVKLGYQSFAEPRPSYFRHRMDSNTCWHVLVGDSDHSGHDVLRAA